jgi:hypothetical protein
MTKPDIDSLLGGLVGQRCEGADNPYGSILRLDIGPLGDSLDAKPGAKPHGWRHLTIESPWRLSRDREVVCDWNDEGGTEGALTDYIAPLVGRTVMEISTAPPGWDLRLTLSGGLGLFVFSDSDDDREDAWFILGTDGLILSAGPERKGGGGLKIKRLPADGPRQE